MDTLHPTRYWRRLDDGRVECTLCPRLCQLRDGKRGVCYMRQAREGEIVLTHWGETSGFCIDPIEKKPLYHYLPGSATLSFGTLGCNLTCRYCQNWSISKSREDERLNERTTPAQIADLALHHGCRSVAFTYNDPVISLEFTLEVAKACHDRGIKAVAVSAGYVNPKPALELFGAMDAANIDLKGFSDDFYHGLCGGALTPVLECLKLIRHQTHCWLEITTLIIPGHNDDDATLSALSQWIARELGADTPLHFTAFHPDFHLTEPAVTPMETLQRARERALANGLHHVYTGNIPNSASESTYCSGCGALLIERSGYRLGQWRLSEGRCVHCHRALCGHFEPYPEAWGPKRLRVNPE